MSSTALSPAPVPAESVLHLTTGNVPRARTGELVGSVRAALPGRHFESMADILSVGVGVRQVARREAWTGLIIGVIVALLFVPLGWLVFGEPRLMLAVGAALFVSCAVASVVAMILPWVLARAGRDPAYGSGPLATVVQDLLTIACYGVIVSIVV